VNPDAGIDLLAQVTGIWGDVLQTDELTESSDFFELGGESLGAIRITAQVREIAGDELPLTLIFDEPLLGDFVAAVAAFVSA